MSKAFSILAAIVALFLVLIPMGTAKADTYVTSRAPTAVIVDGATGKVLFSKNGDAPIPPASMSKLMTAAIVLDRLSRDQLSLETPFDISEKAWRTGGSKMFVLVNTQISVENLLKGLLVHSGNDAAVAIAENISGSVDEFVVLMNQQAQTWGLSQSTFANPIGEDHENQKMSALDIAKLSRKIWYDYPQYQYLFGIPRFEWSNINQPNRNPLLSTFEGADGLKTGHTDDAGWSLAGTAQKDGERRFIIVSGLQTSQDRAREATRLMDIAFAEFSTRTFFTANEIVSEAEVFGGRHETVPLRIDLDVTRTLHNRQFERASAKISYSGPLKAPINKGEQVAVLKLTIPDETPVEYPLYAAENSPELGFIAKMQLGLTLLFTPPEEPLF